MVIAQMSEREKEIVRLLAGDPGISVTRLSELLSVSVVTIRSDLTDLEQKGVLLRTRGGAAPAYHPNVLERQSLNVEAKSRIAQAAAAMVNDGDSIMIEAGTTTALVARHLLGKRFVNIVTNSTLILPFARTNPGIHLTVVGGEFRPASESMVGPMALAELQRFHVRLAFVGTDGFSLDGGLTTHLVEGAEIVRRMAERSEIVVLVADSSKYGRVGFVRVLPVEGVHRLVTDTGLEERAERELFAVGLQVIKA
jgi:DeoR family transcriptional regulator, galactitol utilization operon repressor